MKDDTNPLQFRKQVFQIMMFLEHSDVIWKTNTLTQYNENDFFY